MLCYNNSMKHIVEKDDIEIYKSAIWDFYFGGLNVGVLDIETTGLSPDRNKFILGGLYNCQTREMHQVLAESRAEEADALREFICELQRLDVIVTYNGRNFDTPFLKKRLAKAIADGRYVHPEDEAVLERLYDLDLFLVVQGHSPIKKLVPNLRQKTIENYMGLWETRTDEISGAESVELFNHYEKTGDPEAERKILLHNSDDVRQLTKLTKIISKCDMHRAMMSMGFPICGMKTGRPKLQSSCLQINGKQSAGTGLCMDYIGYEFHGCPVYTAFSSADGTFQFEVPVMRNSGMTLVDLDALGLDRLEFEQYPTCESGYLIIEDREGLRHMEINHFTKAFIKKFQEEAL